MNSASAYGLEAAYADGANFAGKFDVKNNVKSTTIGISATAGYQNFQAGVGLDVDATNGNFALKDVNFGAEVAIQKDATLTARTANNQKDITVSANYKVNAALTTGLSLLVHPSDFSNVGTVGLEYELSKVPHMDFLKIRHYEQVHSKRVTRSPTLRPVRTPLVYSDFFWSINSRTLISSSILHPSLI